MIGGLNDGIRERKLMRKKRSMVAAIGLMSAALMMAAPGAHAQEGASVKLGIVAFLSGAAAGPFGVPARNAAELTIETLNAGKLPAPYDKVGINGLTIESVIGDEAGGATKQVTEYRNLAERAGVDAVIGYISSGDCLAIAPLADELKLLTVFFDCGTPRVFEEGSYKYLFRTGGTATMDSVGAARYLLEKKPDVATVGGINQNYAWGQDSWADFSAAIKQLKPEATVGESQFPKLLAGQYGAEISALLVQSPDAIHSSLWGGDMEAFTLQGKARGVFDDSAVILTTGETAMFRLAKEMPEGTIIGARGPHGVLAPDNELNKWFRKAYIDRFGTLPTYPSYKMTQAILGLKAAMEKAAGGSEGKPDTEATIAAFENLTFNTPSGEVRMTLGNGHQAIQPMSYGTYKYDPDKGAQLVDVVTYAAECVNPPAGKTSAEWIAGGFEGAKCE
jgi:branched-chain amino acid transport system substrate-binding protein